jgi:hypothetical protein
MAHVLDDSDDRLPRMARKRTRAPAAGKPVVVPVKDKPIAASMVRPGTVTGIIDATMAIASRACHWPFGDPRDALFHYCGDAATKPYGYCTTHETRARKPITVKT